MRAVKLLSGGNGMRAVKLLSGVKLYVIREYAVMRDGATVCKIADREGRCTWVDASELEVVEV